MKVVTEAHFVRKNQILDTAENFFFEKGYAKTTIVDIINKIEIANGTFYHYFKSKDELLMAIINRDLEGTEKRISKIVEDPAFNAIEKMNKIYSSSFDRRLETRERTKMLLIEFYHNEDNIVFLHKKQKEYKRIVTPLLAKLLDQGKQEGTFDVVSPKYSAELMVNMGAHLDEAFAQFLHIWPPQPSDKEILVETYEAYSTAIHRLLGVPQGSLKIINMENIEIFFSDSQT